MVCWTVSIPAKGEATWTIALTPTIFIQSLTFHGHRNNMPFSASVRSLSMRSSTCTNSNPARLTVLVSTLAFAPRVVLDDGGLATHCLYKHNYSPSNSVSRSQKLVSHMPSDEASDTSDLKDIFNMVLAESTRYKH